ncbi:hypothetical protein CMI46_02780 [Candidatus Pacearchaeota archaeon]|nr:hypothetical protein [Candidatus Pacearchaeota archaeon]|tara:strand:+ start:184 stop:804 length:621 start_codon:yes stop_codon:yes gene_type:complete
MVGISDDQFGSIRRCLEASLTIQEDFPNIFDLYQKEGSALNVAKSLDLSKKYHLSEEQTERAIYGAIQGHSGGFGIDSFQGLVEKTVWENARFQNQSARGKELKKKKQAVHGRTPEKKHADALEGVKAKGFTHWYSKNENGESEIACAYRLSCDPEHHHKSGAHLGKPHCKKIAQELNREYKNSRSPVEVKKAIRRHKRNLLKQST